MADIYILIKATDDTTGRPLPWNMGFLVDVFDHDVLFGKQVPPKFCQICVTGYGGDVAQFKLDYLMPGASERRRYKIVPGLVTAALAQSGTATLPIAAFNGNLIDMDE